MSHTNISGKFLTAIYESDEFSVCLYKCNGTDVRVVGDSIPHIKSLVVSFSGTWETTKYGEQFKATSYDIELPTSEEGVIAYFSLLKCGVGKIIASRIYAKFGSETFKIIETDPERLLEIKGIKEKQLNNIKRKYEETRILRNVLALCGDNLSSTYAIKAIQKFKNGIINIIEHSIYRLCEVPGIGFQTVETLAKSRNANMKTKDRVIHALYHLDGIHKQSGHTCYPREAMLKELFTLLNTPEQTLTFNELKELLLPILSEKKEFIVFDKYIYSAKAFYEERVIANKIKILKNSALRIPHDLAVKCVENVCEKITFLLAPEQKLAVINALENGVSIITGGPGTGKSTVISVLLKAYELAHNSLSNGTSKYDNRLICLLAPTGRAAKRITETTGREASTIHSRIGLYSDDVDAEISIDSNLIVIDESSMIDQHVMYALLDNIQPGGIVVFVGDANQLPSVGAGNVFGDMIKSEMIPTVELKLVFRQGQQSTIHLNAEKVKDGISKIDINKSDFFFTNAKGTTEIIDSACTIYERAVKSKGIDNVILLSPQRKRGEVCSNVLNKELQSRINPRRGDELVVTSHETEFRKNDRVMQLKNKEYAKNGEVGTIIDIQYLRAEEIAGLNGVSEDTVDSQVCAIIDFDGQEYAYTKEMLQEIDLAYCMSVHKAQGCEYKIVIMVMDPRHWIMLTRRLFYTAITRAAKVCWLVGSKDLIPKAINNTKEATRYTTLSSTIQLISKGGV